MKRTFSIIVLLLIAITSFSQVKPSQTLRRNWLVDSTLMFTPRDTSFTTTQPALLYRSADNSFYFYNLSRWSKIGSNSIFSNGITSTDDSVFLGGSLIRNTALFGNNIYDLTLSPRYLNIGSIVANNGNKVMIVLDTTGSTPSEALASYYKVTNPNLSLSYGFNAMYANTSIKFSSAPASISSYTYLAGLLARYNIPASPSTYTINSKASPVAAVTGSLNSENGNLRITDFAWFYGGSNSVDPSMATFTGRIDTAYGFYQADPFQGQMSDSIYRAYGIYLKGPATYNYLAGHTGFGINTSTSAVDINGTSGDTGADLLRIRKSFTPTGSADAAGQVGSWAWDDNYFYVKTSTGWKRAALTTF